jgi:cytochrome c553
MMNKHFWGTCLALSAFVAPPLMAGDIEAGKVKSTNCAGCHGTDGNSVNPEWPSLAGQGQAYLVKQLKDFKTGARENAMMAPMAAALSEQDMEDVAAFYASQKATGGAANPDMLELG